MVRCSVRDAEGRLTALRAVRLAAGTPASAVVDAVLRLALEERRHGGSLAVEAPADLVTLLALSGLGDPQGGIRP